MAEDKAIALNEKDVEAFKGVLKNSDVKGLAQMIGEGKVTKDFVKAASQQFEVFSIIDGTKLEGRKIASQLLEMGADPVASAAFNHSPLAAAASKGNEKYFDLLLEHVRKAPASNFKHALLADKEYIVKSAVLGFNPVGMLTHMSKTAFIPDIKTDDKLAKIAINSAQFRIPEALFEDVARLSGIDKTDSTGRLKKLFPNMLSEVSVYNDPEMLEKLVKNYGYSTKEKNLLHAAGYGGAGNMVKLIELDPKLAAKLHEKGTDDYKDFTPMETLHSRFKHKRYSQEEIDAAVKNVTDAAVKASAKLILEQPVTRVEPVAGARYAVVQADATMLATEQGGAGSTKAGNLAAKTGVVI